MQRYSTLKTRTPLRAKKPWNPVRKPLATRTTLKAKKKNALKKGGSFIPADVRADMSTDPEYTRCGLQGLLGELIGECGGRVTREHAMIFAGSKIQEKFAVIPCCAKHHGVDEFQDAPGQAPKEVRVWVALNRGTDEELLRYSKSTNYIRERARLNEKYGVYVPPLIPKQK